MVGVVETASCADREMGSDDGTNADADAKRTADTDNGDNRTMLDAVYRTTHGSKPPAKWSPWSRVVLVVFNPVTQQVLRAYLRRIPENAKKPKKLD